ncbi:MAG: molybdenum transporter, periplasmic molybdate-binding protein [Acidobacteria bacterium]|nr:molybdenum transporter, periplasmic molybdate-binding protein [Acidobacteriota bacterium]
MVQRVIQKLIIGVIVAFVSIHASPNACAMESPGAEILVSAAMSLKNAFGEIGALYEKRTGVRVRFNMGASGLLQKQIETGAPVDVFASAGENQMDVLQAKGLILVETRRNFARNSLVLVVPAWPPSRIHAFADLTRAEVTRVAIGNPKTVPAGQYAREALMSLKLWDRLQSRLVLAENVRQVLDYVVRGEAEAGIVYASDIAAAHGQISVAARAPASSHGPVFYPIAVVRDTSSRDNAKRFVDLTLSREGQAILVKYGFLSAR